MKKEEKEIESFCPASQEEWRAWLAENHSSKQSVWLVYHKIKSGVPSISWNQAVDEALCFGWIDSTARSIDDKTFMQFFCRRKPNSVWSKINKAKVERLIKEGLMTTAGFDSIEKAKQNGSWIILDKVEELKIPKDLTAAFKVHRGSRPFFLSLSKSVQKSILQWLVLAKKPETRQKRINEIATLAGQKLKPVQFR
ncbi:YdeI/OmpD-associated family protein [Pedobacter roseus]|uniref:YdeI/OmpD-associated family protein n=1 Tax=Pedobacter roseus TaxID=336820 RepID=A0A7G9QFR2_9SPHI|nr:YdeI/OmpD-associated family protein [Pedobacter roseus]QNN42187.1 YdeI/OmpD-associated family protein [Pedobacter roseus]